MILDKPHMILGYFHERLFSQYGIQLHDQWVKMSEKLKCSENTIRKYRNEIPKSKAEVILNTAVELGLECGMSGGNLKLFYRNFIQSVKQYFGTMIWLRQELIVKINEMPQSDEEKWEKIVCPIPVERKINEFLKNDNKKFLYICGSHKSGIIVSVEKFLWNMDEKKKLPHVYDIRNKSLKDLEQDSKLQDALRTEEVILFCVGYEMFPPEMLEWDYSGKVIIAAHIPYVKKYIPYMEYMVFDDAVNQYNCIEAIVQGYIPEVLNEIKQRENGLVQKFINKIGRITGGIPLAIRILGEAIQEKNVFALADNLEEILEEDFYLKKTLKPTYEQMWTEFLSYVWTQISEETKNAIVIASYFKGDISLELFHFLVGKNAASEKWRNILEECYHYMLLMESGKSNEEENGGVQGVRMFCLTRELIRFKYWDEWEYGQVMTLSAEFYAQKVRDLDCNKTYRGEKTFFDRGGEIAIVEEVLNYCYENRLDEAFLTISHGLEDFSFMRSQYDKLMRSLHDMGVTVARRSGQYKELLNIYGYKMKHAVQKNQKERAKGIFKEAEELIRKDKRFTEISFAQCPEYAHGKALVLFLVEKKFSDAAVIWEEIAEQNEVDERSKLLYRFWKSKCIFNEQNAALGELEEVFQQMLRECEEFRYYILTTECNLYLATIYMLMALKEKDAFYLESVQKHLNDTVHAMKHCCFMENRYKMHFRILSYYLSAINHNEEYQTLFTDSSIQWRNWTKQVAEKLYKNGLDNINYGEIAGEIVRFLPQQ